MKYKRTHLILNSTVLMAKFESIVESKRAYSFFEIEFKKSSGIFVDAFSLFYTHFKNSSCFKPHKTPPVRVFNIT